MATAHVYSVCWLKSREPWPECSFSDVRSACELAEALRESVADDIAVISETGRVVERYSPCWEDPDEIYPLWSLTSDSSEAFWRQHPEIRSSDAATERYFMSSGTAVSVFLKHWPFAEAMWLSILERSEYAGEREESLDSSPCQIPAPEFSESSLIEPEDLDWSSSTGMAVPSSPPTYGPGWEGWPAGLGLSGSTPTERGTDTLWT